MPSLRALPLLALVLPLGGCQFLPHHDFFVPADNEPNPAWVRMVNYTQHSALYQYPASGRTGGLIRSSEWVLINTQDRGMPKAGQDLTFDYYETPVVPGVKTSVQMEYQGPDTDFCVVAAEFVPQAGHYYQFELNSGYRLGKCTMSATLVERGDDGEWHLKPNAEVTYPDGNESQTIYFSEPREAPAPVYDPYEPSPVHGPQMKPLM
ncbi:hypothetical protein [Pseudomonas sp. LRF_L74]|uniref:hypothetical protein n=1 Tax=Pseudomonas sp. LRF_L74 TaxID=3369422 RepID=UPI003F606DBB